MHVFSSAWFYNLAAFAQRHPRLCSPMLVEVFCQVANEIDERNGVIPPVAANRSIGCRPYDWQTQQALDAVRAAAMAQLEIKDPPEFQHDREPDRKPCGCKLICLKYAAGCDSYGDIYCVEEATKYRKSL